MAFPARQTLTACDSPGHGTRHLRRLRPQWVAAPIKNSVDDRSHLSAVSRPWRLIVADLRDEFIEQDEALGLCGVLLQLFAGAKYQGPTARPELLFRWSKSEGQGYTRFFSGVRFAWLNLHVIDKLRRRLDTGDEQKVSCPCAGDVKQLAFGVISLL